MSSFIAFYSAKKDFSVTLNSFLVMVAKVKQGFSLSSFCGNNFLFLSHSCTNKSLINILHT